MLYKVLKYIHTATVLYLSVRPADPGCGNGRAAGAYYLDQERFDHFGAGDLRACGRLDRPGAGHRLRPPGRDHRARSPDLR